MCEDANNVKSLQRLAAEAVPQETSLVGLHRDIIALIDYYRTIIITCLHGTMWSYAQNKVNGVVAYRCGCVEVWGDDDYREPVTRCYMYEKCVANGNECAVCNGYTLNTLVCKSIRL